MMAKPDISRNLLILIGVGVIILVGYYFMDHSKKKKEIKRLEKIHSAYAESLRVARETAARLEEVQRQYEIVKLQHQKAQEMLPKEENIPDVLRSLTRVGAASGVNFLLFKKEQKESKGKYAVIPISIQVSGSYHEIARFLAAINNLSRIVNVENLTLAPGREGGVTASFLAKTYIATEVTGEKKPTKKGKKRKKG
ncbi:hypothetical protein DRQ20_02300 [bacterium]|nr:MAG: hypothetical protein DRQ20_02300 [bacterium]